MRLAGGLALALLLAAIGLSIWLLRGSVAEAPLLAPDLSDISVEEIVFESDGNALSARLFTPAGQATATAVLLGDAGETERDDPWALQIVRGLANADVAVLLTDKRGTGLSEGDWRTSSYDALARDAARAIAEMRARFANRPLTLIGLGEGGRIAPLVVATTDARADRVVALSSSLSRAHAALLQDERLRLRDKELPDFLAQPMARLLAWHRREVREALLWAVRGDFDPLPHWAALDVPALIILGGQDRRVDLARARERLESLESDGIELLILEPLDHRLRAKGTDRISSDAIDSLVAFVGEGSL